MSQRNSSGDEDGHGKRRLQKTGEMDSENEASGSVVKPTTGEEKAKKIKIETATADSVSFTYNEVLVSDSSSLHQALQKDQSIKNSLLRATLNTGEAVTQHLRQDILSYENNPSGTTGLVRQRPNVISSNQQNTDNQVSSSGLKEEDDSQAFHESQQEKHEEEK